MTDEEWSETWRRVVGPAFYESCANCGDNLNHGDLYPVITERNDGDELSLYSFCDEECLTAWDAAD